MLSEVKELYLATLARPDDDLPFLVLCDKLEELGLDQWAEIIRLWIESRRIDRRYKYVRGRYQDVIHWDGLPQVIKSDPGFWGEEKHRHITIRFHRQSQDWQRLEQDWKWDGLYRIVLGSGFRSPTGRDIALVDFVGIPLYQEYEEKRSDPILRTGYTNLTFRVVEDTEYARKEGLDKRVQELKKSHLWTLPGFCRCRARAVWMGPLVTQLFWRTWSSHDWCEWETHHQQLLSEFPFLKEVRIHPPRFKTRNTSKTVWLDRSFTNPNTGVVQTVAGEPINWKEHKKEMTNPYSTLENTSLKMKWPDVDFLFVPTALVVDDIMQQYGDRDQDTPSPMLIN